MINNNDNNNNNNNNNNKNDNNDNNNNSICKRALLSHLLLDSGVISTENYIVLWKFWYYEVFIITYGD